MEFQISVDVIRNNGYGLSALDFTVYCLLLRSSNAKQSKEIIIDYRLLKNFAKIDDNRTVKKILKSLIDYELIKEADNRLSRKGALNIKICDTANKELFEIKDEDINLIKKLNPFSFRLHILYETFKNSVGKLTYNDIRKLYKVSTNTITEARKQLVELNLLNEDKPDINDIDADDLLYFTTEEIKPKFKNFNEKKLENILIKNMELIEHGMEYIDNQYEVTDGRVDIFSRDKDGVMCVIELKVVEDDEKLVFQSVYYPTQFNEKVRMITIAPGYTNKIRTSLQSLKYVEMKIYRFDGDSIVIEDIIK